MAAGSGCAGTRSCEGPAARGRLRYRWRVFIALVASCAVGVVFPAALVVMGLRYNDTPSAPLGWYWRRPVSASGPALGDFVAVCPPAWVTPLRFPFYERGHGDDRCPGGGEPLVKRIAAVPGDTVVETAAGVQVNGRALPLSAPMPASPVTGIRLPWATGRWALARGEYWLYGPGAAPGWARYSFDSRYFGPVPRTAIRGVLVRF